MKKLLTVFLILFSLLSLADSIYNPNSKFSNIIASPRASKVGDVVNILVYESPRFSTSSEVDSFKNTILGAISSGSKILGSDLSGFLPIKDSDKVKSSNKSQTSVILQITAVVKKVDEYGNLYVEGRKNIKVGNDLREIIITGWVNPEMISAKNTVNSTDLMDAQIWENGKIIFEDDPNEGSWLGLILSSLAELFR
ncbi:flagellar L-ring protein [Thermosipho africanus H17ap60334]|jgi:flagellar L-ring protein precursor FlgH|uniref:Flagellar L-ring protein FlgH n=1 Tax=Thermosipho africanus (strain TCF52B) TaxID=484019 RepID=B7IH04_THEAB|nr:MULTISPECIES: flagellar basal body L-ring protein FlgH [Thermosipho]HCF37551.1 flagellar basal body L-ring protein FlgH [Thermosipho africanus]ACJ75368.1 flagellar L-ring protein FlgH [Thermosipho africanus TCF52B]EKF50143.1 flagellar L-ring protein [Thermosipho africanus H17ap60334]MBZ4651032.1 flgH [Thermosipho sp. (in: thermotogales)]MDK2840042.1 flagellar L-ring protein FlgH [Thermosipho sp. (in: thermotogales)]